MKTPILWLSIAGAAVAAAIGLYAALRGTPDAREVVAPVPSLADPADEPAVRETHPEIVKKTGPARGIASFYRVASNGGTRTASGVPLNDSLSTAAHRTLPFGTQVRVTNLENGFRETVVITDRGPFIDGRIIDVSRRAAEKLGMVSSGIVSVEIEVLPEAPKSQTSALVEQ